ANELIAAIPGSSRLTEQHRDRFHKVRRGETLSRIASRYGVRETALVAANNLRSRNRISVGQVLVLPDRGGRGYSEPVVVASNEPADALAPEPTAPDGSYRV